MGTASASWYVSSAGAPALHHTTATTIQLICGFGIRIYPDPKQQAFYLERRHPSISGGAIDCIGRSLSQ